MCDGVLMVDVPRYQGIALRVNYGSELSLEREEERKYRAEQRREAERGVYSYKLITDGKEGKKKSKPQTSNPAH